jgi:hypothetical protein
MLPDNLRAITLAVCAKYSEKLLKSRPNQQATIK